MGTAAVAWLGTFVSYMVGSGRAYDYDSAETVHVFVRTDSLADAFTRQIYFNNHPLFSFLEHVVYSLTGSASEPVMRVLPVAFSATAVGLLVWWTTRRWGVLAGACGGAVLATHPLMTETGRDVRGYSLMLLMAVVVGLIAIDPAGPAPRKRTAFGVATAIGVGTHLYMLMPLSLAVAWMVLTGRWDRAWSRCLSLGGIGGLACYLAMDSFGRSGRRWRPSFPSDLAWELLGATAVSVAAWILLALLVLRRPLPLRARPKAAVVVSAMVVAFLAGPWLVAPTDLFPRFFLWLVPLLAAWAAWAVAQQGRRAFVVGAAVVATVAAQVPDWNDDLFPNRDLGAAAAGLGASCGVDHRIGGYAFYDPDVRRIRLDDDGPAALDACDVLVFLVPTLAVDLIGEVQPAFPVRCEVASDRIDGALLLPADSTCPPGTVRRDPPASG
ncbi:MAG: hypothetical protein ACRDYW_07290 [Acidimicrobiales bacterium]